MRNLFERLVQGVVLVEMLLTVLPLEAQVNWQFQLGGMFMKQYGGGEGLNYTNGVVEKNNNLEGKAALLLQIPMSHRLPVFLETGLAFRTKIAISQEEGYKFDPKNFYYGDNGRVDCYRADGLEIPVKFGWKLRLNENNAFDFGAGPYVAAYFDKGLGDPVSVGVNLSAAFRHRCMSFGVEWQNPLFLDGLRDYNKNSFAVTVGINFKIGSVNLDKLANALEATSSVLSTASASMGYEQSDSYNYPDVESEESSSTISRSTKKSTGKTTGKSKEEKGFSLSEQTDYNRDKSTYAQWETYLLKDGLSKKERDHAKDEMKRLRKKWEKRGKPWTKSRLED